MWFPTFVRYVVDVRSNDRYGNEEMLEMIRSVCKAKLIPRSTRLKPSGLEEEHFLMEAVFAMQSGTLWLLHPV